jgi:hypothetical protein
MTLQHQPKHPLIAGSRLVSATSPPRPPLSMPRHLLLPPPGQHSTNPSGTHLQITSYARSFNLEGRKQVFDGHRASAGADGDDTRPA